MRRTAEVLAIHNLGTTPLEESGKRLTPSLDDILP
jgi:hypothetical protein